MTKTKHRWTGNGYNTWCSNCHVDEYEFPTRGEFCEDMEAERAAWKKHEAEKPMRIQAALDKVRSVLTKEEFKELDLYRFGEYRPRDWIRV